MVIRAFVTVNSEQISYNNRVGWKLNGFTFLNLRVLAPLKDEQSIYLQASPVLRTKHLS